MSHFVTVVGTVPAATVSRGHPGQQSGKETDIKRLRQTQVGPVTRAGARLFPPWGWGGGCAGGFRAGSGRSSEGSPGSPSRPDPRSYRRILLAQLEATPVTVPHSLMGMEGVEGDGDRARMGTGSPASQDAALRVPRAHTAAWDPAPPSRPQGAQVEVVVPQQSCPSVPRPCRGPRACPHPGRSDIVWDTPVALTPSHPTLLCSSLTSMCGFLYQGLLEILGLSQEDRGPAWHRGILKAILV